MNDDQTDAHNGPPKTSREWQLLEKVIMQAGKEQRAARRWSVFFKLLTFTYLFALLWLFSADDMTGGGAVERASDHVAVIDIRGTLMDGGDTTADDILESVREAFESKHARAIMLRINSPGGTPVQAGTVFREIMTLRKDNPDKKVYAVITDLGASGAYYVAAAADEIYADPSSIVGSIGVISEGFGFVGAMEKLGVERRMVTAGERKGFLDPFSPANPEDQAYFAGVLDNVHRQFINAVKEGRGDRLKKDPHLFTGLVWSGEQALALGLIDGLGNPDSVARTVIGETALVDYSAPEDPFSALADRLGVQLGTWIRDVMVAESRSAPVRAVIP